jgi:hypothetical protein
MGRGCTARRWRRRQRRRLPRAPTHVPDTCAAGGGVASCSLQRRRIIGAPLFDAGPSASGAALGRAVPRLIARIPEAAARGACHAASCCRGDDRSVACAALCPTPPSCALIIRRRSARRSRRASRPSSPKRKHMTTLQCSTAAGAGRSRHPRATRSTRCSAAQAPEQHPSQRVLARARARAVLVEHKGRVTVRRWPHRSSSYSEMLGHRRLGKSAEAGHARPAGCQRASMQRCARDRADGRHGKGYAMALLQRAPAVRMPPRGV